MTSTSIRLEPGSPIRLTTYTKRTPLIIRIILGGISLLAFISPVIALIMMLASGKGFKAGIVVSFLIMWSIGVYILRVVLWNSYGKEIVEFDSNHLHYNCDYKYFQSNQQKIGTEQLQIEIVNVSESEQTSKLLFVNGSEKLEMVLPIPDVELIPVKHRLNELLIK